MSLCQKFVEFFFFFNSLEATRDSMLFKSSRNIHTKKPVSFRRFVRAT